MKTRNQLIDIAKGLSMVLIVLFHCDIFHDFLFQFHVPVFAFLSGYVFNTSKYCLSGKDGIKKCFVNKIRTLYVPFVVYNFIYIVFHNQFVEWNFLISSRGGVQYSLQEIAYRFVQTLTMGSIESLLTPLWFLPCLMMAIVIYTVMAYITLKITNNRYHVVMLTATFVLSVIGYIVSLPRNVNLSFILLFWFNIGVYVREKDILVCIKSTIESRKKGKLLTIFLTVISCMIIAFSTNYRETWFDAKLFIPLAYFSIFGGIYLVILGSYAISKCKVACRVFSKIGCHTVMILALHITCFRLVDTIQVAVYEYPLDMRGMGTLYHNGIWIIIYPVAGIFIPLAISSVSNLLKRTPEDNKD